MKKSERGGIIGIAARINGNGSNLSLKSRVNDQGTLKVAMLFVDRLDKIANNLIRLGDEDDADITGIGLGSQSKVIYSSGVTYEQISYQVWHAYQELNKREPGRWSLWQQYDNSIIPTDCLSPDLAFQLQLKNALIVPDASTPFEDVIGFKEKHRDELIAFRHYFEDLAIKISKEGDIRAVNLECERFDFALAEYLKKARQSNIRKSLASLTAEIDWAAAVRNVVGGSAGGMIAATQGLSIEATTAAITGGILASLSIKSVPGLTKADTSPFRYIARIEREYGS
ncbi:DUF6236 family protein [Sphingomonas sp. SFZ2018-12]|uniref:DUF6236 family protein n=1 Tax=Sphingomonas sp. SFZ2018-12 TaxID=2683197 RepID=UPI001F0E0108|nr:DUF6236 family protein [Sphingomonas sp. SFZ2018-12]